jgi:hypothetical protein
VHRILTSIHGVIAIAGLAAFVTAETAPYAHAQAASAQQPATKRQYKDNGEFDAYSTAYKDSANPAKQIQDLEAWAQKYPDSDYKDIRLGMLVQAYAAMNPPQPAKVLELGGQLMTKDLKTVFDDPNEGKRLTVQFYFALTFAAGLAGTPALPNPTPEQVQLGNTAAMKLKEAAPEYITPANKPPNVSDADWGNILKQFNTSADHTRLVLEIYQAEAVLNKNPKVSEECKGIAEPAYRKALGDFPENTYLSYQLAKAMQCQQKESPEKVFQAEYEYERAAVLDPKLGGAQPDAKVVPAFADGTYIKIHGSDEGLDALKAQVKTSALPPDGFKIKTSHEVAAEKEAEFEANNPELAMWMRIKGALTDPADPDYFTNKLKDTAGPKLKGTLVAGACRAKEVKVAFPVPGATGEATPEVTLKFEAPLSGKPELNAEVTFEGAVATAFSKDPFMLTMEIEKSKVEGLKVTPCVPGPVAPKKK